jgi:hypothetical protein
MWCSGDTILMRHVRFGRVLQALPVRVVEDDGDRLVTWIAPETTCIYPNGLDAQGNLLPLEEWRLTLRNWTGSGNVDVLDASTPFAIRHVWADEALDHWYVNLQEPYRRTTRGYDTMDHQLDVVLRRDGRDELKDEHHLAQAQAIELFGPEETADFLATAADVLAGRAELVPTGYESFRPDPRWKTPALPPDWHVV